MPSVTCNACGHLTPDEQTYCERCGAQLRGERHPSLNAGAIVLGLVAGVGAFAFTAFWIDVIVGNMLAPHPSVQNAGLVDFGIVVLLAGVIVMLFKNRRVGNGFLVAMLVVMLGGFAICGGIFTGSSN